MTCNTTFSTTLILQILCFKILTTLMTEPHAMPGVACGQGHECSPVRSKIMATFIQQMASRVCRGYRFGRTGTPQAWYADDSCWLCEDRQGGLRAVKVASRGEYASCGSLKCLHRWTTDRGIRN